MQLILTLKEKGLGYRRIAQVLNEKGIKTHKGSVWGGNYVCSVLKRYRQRLERIEFRKMNTNLSFQKCG